MPKKNKNKSRKQAEHKFPHKHVNHDPQAESTKAVFNTKNNLDSDQE